METTGLKAEDAVRAAFQMAHTAGRKCQRFIRDGHHAWGYYHAPELVSAPGEAVKYRPITLSVFCTEDGVGWSYQVFDDMKSIERFKEV